MAKFAVMKGETVSNIIVANTKEDAELATNSVCIEYTDDNPAFIGGTWDGTIFIPPVTDESL